ncbi:LytS/YhcK type 5TM receptor domain-containing protein [Lactobacillus delbrueckii]|uniref:LytS/YhcK type 5TM receptor domain-containing protein n=1 Tax=Lactobacillus delbrueckii TaxID=1584 RepID=UPI0023E37652|nr:LytS/YhcK type 5TM receptor domain-containing protein [Lactobacillus delbrueckii]MDF4030457.1 LytS/YhcK type 5TM receptor domain-containing protein [Lactobacillus delbrueckii]
MWSLSLLISERVGMVVLLAFLLVNVNPFRRLLFHQTISAKLQLFVIFSLFTIVANLTGIEIDRQNHLQSTIILTKLSPTSLVANARVLAVSLAGITGGPWVGAAVGLVAGLHRVIQGSVNSSFYIASSILIGVLSGLAYGGEKRDFSRPVLLTPWQGFTVGIVMEVIQMVFILLFSDAGWSLVRFIALPMIAINSLGTYAFLSVISTYIKQEQETRVVHIQSLLDLVDKTMPYFRSGLNPESSQEVAWIIKRYTNSDAISLTTRNEILAHVGAGSDHHVPTKKMVVTHLSEKAIKTGEVQIAHSEEQIGCSNPDCPLQAALIVPLRVNDKVVGTLNMYYVKSWELTPVEIQLASSLKKIFSCQIALGQAENQAKLVREAEIKALQAQVNPHFFFNAINTIVAMIRKDSDKARELLIQLSLYFRSNLLGVRETQITLQQELDQVNAYLTLELSRFPDRYEIHQEISVNEQVLLPPFMLQILLENALKHAFNGRMKGNEVWLSVSQVGKRIKVQVEDNGTGIKPEVLAKLGKEEVSSESGSGTALQNLNQRLIQIYDERSQLNLTSSGAGTTVTAYLPLTVKEG